MPRYSDIPKRQPGGSDLKLKVYIYIVRTPHSLEKKNVFSIKGFVVLCIKTLSLIVKPSSSGVIKGMNYNINKNLGIEF